MNRRRATALALASVALAALPGTGDRAAADPLEDARTAATRVDFSARVLVRWQDRRGPQRVELDVRAEEGVVRVSGPQELMAFDGSRLVLSGDRWAKLWPGGLAPAPPVSDKYVSLRRPGPIVAGRETEIVELRADGRPRERLYVDEESGLMLRREVLSDDGKVIRLVAVQQLDLRSVVRPEPEAPEAETVALEPLDEVPPPFLAPDRLDGGFQLLGAYRRGRTIHALYSDGVHSLSLFEQRGRLDADEANGDPVLLGPEWGWWSSWPGGEIVTWEAGGAVFTVVSDAHPDDVLRAARSLPEPRPASLADRLRRVARGLVETLSGG